MKINKNTSFPHPVLGVADSIGEGLTLEDYSLMLNNDNPNHYEFYVKLEIKNKDIIKLLKSGKAIYACEVECVDTFYRNCIQSNSNEMYIYVDRTQVAGKLSFTPTVIAVTDIPNYNNSESHRHYYGYSFNLSKGDYLAIFPERIVPISLKFNKLYAAGSFIQVDMTDKKMTWVNLNEEKIVVMLPKKLYEMYESFHKRQDYAAILHASIVMNALAEAITHITESQYSDKLWANAICQRVRTEKSLKDFVPILNEESISCTKAIELAQLLLQDPYDRLFRTLTDLNV